MAMLRGFDSDDYSPEYGLLVLRDPDGFSSTPSLPRGGSEEEPAGTFAGAGAGWLTGQAGDDYHVVRLEVHDGPPPDDHDDFDDVQETPYLAGGGGLELTMLTGGAGGPADLELGGPGGYRVRIGRRRGDGSGDHWLLRFWPAADLALPVWLKRGSSAVVGGNNGWQGELEYAPMDLAGIVGAACRDAGGPVTADQVAEWVSTNQHREGWLDRPTFDPPRPPLTTGHADLDQRKAAEHTRIVERLARSQRRLDEIAAELGVPPVPSRREVLPLLAAAGILIRDGDGDGDGDRYRYRPGRPARVDTVLSLPPARARSVKLQDDRSRYGSLAEDLESVLRWAAELPLETSAAELAARLLVSEEELLRAVAFAVQTGVVHASGSSSRLVLGLGRHPAPSAAPTTPSAVGPSVVGPSTVGPSAPTPSAPIPSAAGPSASAGLASSGPLPTPRSVPTPPSVSTPQVVPSGPRPVPRSGPNPPSGPASQFGPTSPSVSTPQVVPSGPRPAPRSGPTPPSGPASQFGPTPPSVSTPQIVPSGSGPTPLSGPPAVPPDGPVIAGRRSVGNFLAPGMRIGDARLAQTFVEHGRPEEPPGPPFGAPPRAGVLQSNGTVTVWRDGERVELARLEPALFYRAMQTRHGVLVLARGGDPARLISGNGDVTEVDVVSHQSYTLLGDGRRVAVVHTEHHRQESRQWLRLIDLGGGEAVTMPWPPERRIVVLGAHRETVFFADRQAESPVMRWTPDSEPEPHPHPVQQIDPVTGTTSARTFDGFQIVRTDGTAVSVPVDPMAQLAPGGTRLWTMRNQPPALTLFPVKPGPEVEPQVWWLPAERRASPHGPYLPPVWEDTEHALFAYQPWQFPQEPSCGVRLSVRDGKVERLPAAGPAGQVIFVEPLPDALAD